MAASHQQIKEERRTEKRGNNARSAVDIQFSSGQRRVRLREGELQVEVAADAKRPFVVTTAQGQVLPRLWRPVPE